TAGQGLEEGATPRLAVWGEGALSSFRGQEATLSLTGDVGTALVGADWRTERWLAGAALSHSWGNGSYAGEDGNDADLSSTLLGLFPYGRYALTPRLGVWAVAGYGWGKLSVTPDDGSNREYRPGSTMVMGAVGLDGLLLDGGAEGLSLTTTIDLLSQRTTTEQVDALSSSEGSVSRLRVGLEAGRPFPLANGAALLPSLEVGMRQDSGDGETGFGLEVGAALAWNDPQRGISAQVKGRSLVTHMEEEFREQSLALSFAWEPDPTNRGPSLAIGHTMGAPASGMDALLNPAGMEGLDDASSGGQQFEAQLAYGFPAFNDRLTMTPGVTLALSPTSSAYTLLWSLAPYAPQPGETTPWELSLEGEQQDTRSSASHPEYSLGLRFSLLF
ncbi:autotransporter outer membrane beta-barrel domain-containing protein, partial [Candidatus Synechococcus spongiarum]|uniref:autotransporter outer membrane beta-barrel domain-containing protein n=1 Tax=Candidatus Synechococcus spongiarum TaxID=431041 RepID=UPI00055593B4